MSMFYELMMKKKGMPSRYQEVEYLESTGRNQFIATNYIPTEDDVIEADLQNMDLSYSADKFFIGQQLVDNTKGGLWVEQYSTGNTWYVRFGSTTSGSSASTTTDRTEKIHITLKKGSFVSSGGTTISPTFISMQNTPITLFGRWNNAGTIFDGFNARFWNFRVTNNGVVKKNFIPVYDTLTNKYGMWESVQGKFYGNDGTGDFKGSIVGYTVVGSPTISDGVVSGFSSANYLKINVPTAINYNVFELNIKFKTSDSSVYQRLVWNSSNLLFVITSGVLSLNFYNTSLNWTSRSAGAIQNNTWYWYKIKFDIVNKTMIADRSTDGINFTNILSSQNISNIYSDIEITTNGIIFCDQDNSGNITLDLNSTNINLNNKLWFNGQQA